MLPGKLRARGSPKVAGAAVRGGIYGRKDEARTVKSRERAKITIIKFGNNTASRLIGSRGITSLVIREKIIIIRFSKITT